MISLSINIRNPYSKLCKDIKNWSGSTPFKNKYWEAQLYRSTDILDLTLRITRLQDHAGVFIEIGLFSYNFIFEFYDHRHWDYDNSTWYKHET